MSDEPRWIRQIRPDHPRLFFSDDTWPAVKARAEGAERAWYEEIGKRVDASAESWGESGPGASDDFGLLAAWAAFCFRMEEEERYLQTARQALRASIAHYEECFQQRKSVNWYAYSRIHYVLAWDWLYEVLPATERQELLERLIDNLDDVYGTRIWRENYSDHRTGYYGVDCCKWYVGCAGLGTGIREERVREWLIAGHDDHCRLLEYRRERAGDDGGAAASTITYAFGEYPHTEFSFFYSWQSATGEDLAPNWPHVGMAANYMLWNWIETAPGQPPLQFAYGDNPHTSNTYPVAGLYTHMRNTRHFCSGIDPGAAALARHIEERVPDESRRPVGNWFIYPFLQHHLDDSTTSSGPPELPAARSFPRMGQVFMRSGGGPADTYALFVCGGDSLNHAHYDALHFTLYHRGFQALDTGTRFNELERLSSRHIENYLCQTVAHNCVLIHLPDEAPASHWGIPRDEEQTEPNHGGQYRKTGSKVIAFETGDLFTYVAGDATACYRAEKCRQMVRQFVFIPPNVFVVFDRVVSTDPSFRKDWLLHTGSEPSIEGAVSRSEHGDGSLFCRTLLPTEADVRVVGGPGNEFRTGQVNWEFKPYVDRPDHGALKADELRLIGQWRLEVSPPVAREADVFLHVIQVGEIARSRMSDAELVEAAGCAGVRLVAGGRDVEITFATEGDVAGHIRMAGDPGVDRPLTDAVMSQRGISGV